MNNKTKKLLLIFFIFLPLIISIIALNYLPDRIPMHYNSNGEVNRWGSKYELLFSSSIGIIIGIINLLCIKYIKNKKNVKAFTAATIIIALTMNVVTIAILIPPLTHTTNINATISSKLIFSSVGLSFVVLGNYMPKCKRNNYFGIRTKLTLSDDEIWFKTQRFGGKLFVGFGLILTIISFILPVSILFWFIISSTLIIAILAYAYPRRLINERKK